MSRMLIFFLIGYLIYVLVKKRSAAKIDTKEASREETYRDPVCGVYVAQGDAVIGRHEGERIHFCSMACLEKYREQLEHAGKADTQEHTVSH